MSAFGPNDWKLTKQVPGAAGTGILRPASDDQKRGDKGLPKDQRPPAKPEPSHNAKAGPAVHAQPKTGAAGTRATADSKVIPKAETHGETPVAHGEGRSTTGTAQQHQTDPHKHFLHSQGQNKQLAQLLRGGQPAQATKPPPQGSFTAMMHPDAKGTASALLTKPFAKAPVPSKQPGKPTVTLQPSVPTTPGEEAQSGVQEQMVAQKTPPPFVEKPTTKRGERREEVKSNRDTSDTLGRVLAGAADKRVGGVGSQVFGEGGFGGFSDGAQEEYGDLSQLSGAGPMPHLPVVLDKSLQDPRFAEATKGMYHALGLSYTVSGKQEIYAQVAVDVKMANETYVGISERAPDVPVGAAYITANGRGKVIA